MSSFGRQATASPMRFRLLPTGARRACLQYFDTAAVQPFLQFPGEFARYHVCVGAQRRRFCFTHSVIIRVALGELAHRRLALQIDILVIVLHVELGLRRIVHLPHHNRSNLDRVAQQVVHLDPIGRQVVRSQGDDEFAGEGVGPVEAGRTHGTAVRTEQHQHTRHVRIHDEVAEQKQERHHEAQAADRKPECQYWGDL